MDSVGGEGGSKEGEVELGLGLGLSLGNGRILTTAKDFPSPSPSPSPRNANAKRERETPNQPSPSASAALISQVVGWPPIRSYRMNTLSNQAKTSNFEEENKKKKIDHGSEKKNEAIKEKGHPGYVKVNMDGLPIGRKLDLNAHNTYQSLANALEEMFFKGGGKEQPIQPPKLLDGSSEFVLTYEDKEGDWMLMGDVPWGMFLSSVKRLRIMQTSEAKGLAPKFQEIKGMRSKRAN